MTTLLMMVVGFILNLYLKPNEASFNQGVLTIDANSTFSAKFQTQTSTLYEQNKISHLRAMQTNLLGHFSQF